MSDQHSYQHPIDQAAIDRHEASILAKGSQATNVDRTNNSTQFRGDVPEWKRMPREFYTEGVTRYRPQRDYSEKDAPILGDDISGSPFMRANVETTQDPETGEESSRVVLEGQQGEQYSADAQPGEVNLHGVNLEAMTKSVKDHGGLGIPELSQLQQAGIPDEFASDVADVIAGREPHRPSPVPEQFSPFVEEFSEYGNLCEESYQQLEQMGVPRATVDAMIAGRAKIMWHQGATNLPHPAAIEHSLRRAAERLRG